MSCGIRATFGQHVEHSSSDQVLLGEGILQGMIHGEVVSVNVGRPQDLQWRGTTVRTAFRKTPVTGVRAIVGTNLVGDGQADLEVHGGRDKCLFAYPGEHYSHWQAWLSRPTLAPGTFGENLTLRGMDESAVAIGDRFRIGTAEVIVTEPRQPCYKIDVSLERDGVAAEMIRTGRVGFYLGLLRAGSISSGDALKYLGGPTVQRMTPQLLHDLNANAQISDIDLLEQTASSPLLSEWWSEMLTVKANGLRRRARRRLEARAAWPDRRTFMVRERREETADVVSLWLAPSDGESLPPVVGGQFVTVELAPQASVSSRVHPFVRCYSVSSITENAWRITVRRGTGDKSASAVACELQAGAEIAVRAPAGQFTLSEHPADAPVVLISGGIGITPVLAIARDWTAAGAPGRLIAVHAMSTSSDDALLPELADLLEGRRGASLDVFVADGSQPVDVRGARMHWGRLDESRLGMIIAGTADKAHGYLCGPLGLVEAAQRWLPRLGLSPSSVHTELFAAPSGTAGQIPVPAGGIEVMFAQRSATLLWTDPGTSLLDLADDAGVDIASSCRQGVCGTCATAVLSGEVSYLRPPAIPVPTGACLACIAVPASRLLLDA